MSRKLTCLAIAFLALNMGCDQRFSAQLTSPPAPSFNIGEIDSSFRLSPAERQSVMDGFSVDALERLLSMVPPESRTSILSAFQHPAPGERPRLLVRLDHPPLQAELEKVWAPYWARYSASEMDREVAYLPGRGEAKRLKQSQGEARQVPDPN